MRGFIALLLAMLAFPVAAHTLSECDENTVSGLRRVSAEELQTQEKVESHLVNAAGQLNYYDFTAYFVIDEVGEIQCLSTRPSGPFEAVALEMTPERQVFLEKLSATRFTPFLLEGRAEKILAALYVTEEERPPYRVLAPAGDLSSAFIRIERHDHHIDPFILTVKGDGSVVYLPTQGHAAGQVIGRQVYKIPSEQVDGMIKAADEADFWSLRDLYWPDLPGRFQIPKEGYSAFYNEITISLGGRVKTFRSYMYGGAPKATETLFDAIAALGKADVWQTIDSNMLTELTANGFDFTSAKGGKLLLAATYNSAVPQTVIDDLINRGAPQNFIDRGNSFDTSLLDAAIGGDRKDMVDNLLEKGALLKDGKSDRTAATRALYHAVSGLSALSIGKIMPYRPALVIRSNEIRLDKKANDFPIITLVPPNHRGTSSAAQFAVTQQLLDAGANINSRNPSGDSLLDEAISIGDIEFAKWLIEHAATIRPEILPDLFDTDMILFLLNTGVELNAETLKRLIAHTRLNKMSQVEAWLRAHGKWPANS